MNAIRVPPSQRRTSSAAFAVALLALTTGWQGTALADAGAKLTKSPVAASPPEPAQATTLVKVDDAWVRATVKGQTASGGFMSLTASRDLTLIGFTTPAAGETELHDMVMEGDVMRMRAIDKLPLPAGQAITLKPGPGGKHLMLMDLKRQLKDGEQVVLKLKLRTADGKTLTQDITVPVKAARPMGGAAPRPAPSAHDGHGHHGH